MNIRNTTLFFRLLAFAILLVLVAYRCAHAGPLQFEAGIGAARYSVVKK